MIRILVTFLIGLVSMHCHAQKHKEIKLMDFVKILPGKKAEAMFYYENNWKLYREEAMKRKIISSYELLETQPDSLNNFDLVLITVYSDSAQYSKSEANFEPILKQLRPNGPVLLNETRPNDFRKNVFLKIASPVFSGRKQ